MMNYHELLYGIPTDKPIIAIDTVKGNSNQLAIYRKVDGRVVREIRRNSYYVYTDMENALQVLEQAELEYDICKGSNVLNVLFYPRDYDEFRWLRSFLPDSRCVSVSGAQGYMIASQENMFYGLQFGDVKRFCFDLEVYSSGHFPDAANPEDKIIMIACKGEEEKLFRLDEYGSEADMITDFLQYFSQVNPDILINQNIFRFDLPYLETRCKMYDIPMALGRDGSTPYSFQTKMKFAEKEVEYPNYNIHGRHVLDTWFMIMAFDVVYRELEAQDLKTAAKHFGLASDSRVYIDGDQIKHYWDDPNKREQLAEYAFDDVREALGIDRVLGQSAFYSTLFFPMQHQDVFRYGTGTKIDSIFLRAYILNKEAYPIADEREEIPGGFAYCPEKGYFDGPLTYADVKSLYPTLRRVLDIRPPKDTLGIYAPLMDLVIEERFRSKDLADKYYKEGNPLFEAENAKQNAIKIVINTGNYGWLSWEYGAFNYYDGGRAITENGQIILKEMIRLCDENGYTVVKGDTDGSLVKIDTWENLDKFYAWLNTQIQEFASQKYGEKNRKEIVITNDGEYEKAIVFDRKSYVLVDRKGKLKIKGNTLKSRSMEPFVKNTLREMVLGILEQDYDLAVLWYQITLGSLNARKLRFKEIAKKSVLNMGRDEYYHKVAAKVCNPSAQYELAYGQEHEVPYRKGDPVWYYVQESGYKFTWFKNGNWRMTKNKTRVVDQARLEKDFSGDYDIAHYTSRLNQGIKRLLPIFGEDAFNVYFPDIPLTKEDLRKIDHGISSEETDDNE
jgi:DNA polymerase, archaea type